jgi:hypothetical protein
LQNRHTKGVTALFNARRRPEARVKPWARPLSAVCEGHHEVIVRHAMIIICKHLSISLKAGCAVGQMALARLGVRGCLSPENGIWASGPLIAIKPR